MKKTQLMMTLSMACAASVALAELQPVESLNLATNAWFSSMTSATETSITVSGGTWSATPAKTGDNASAGYYEVDSDATTPLTFTATTASSEKISSISVDMIASYVPATITLASPTDARVGFAIQKTSDSAAVYKVFLGSEWTTVTTPATPVSNGSACTLKIEIDRRASTTAPLVRFTVISGDTSSVLKVGTTEWHTLGSNPSQYVDFIGSGEIQNLVAKNYTIESETIVVPGSSDTKIKIPEASMTKIQEAATKAGASSVSAYLAQEVTVSSATITRMDAQVLFNKPNPSDADIAAVKTKGDPTSGSASKVGIKMNGFSVQTGSSAINGASVSYQLMGSTDGSTWTNVGAAQSSESFQVDSSASYRYYKIKATVTYQNANNQ